MPTNTVSKIDAPELCFHVREKGGESGLCWGCFLQLPENADVVLILADARARFKAQQEPSVPRAVYFMPEIGRA